MNTRLISSIVIMFSIVACNENAPRGKGMPAHADSTNLEKNASGREGKMVNFTLKHKFGDFSTGIYTGNLAEPKPVVKDLPVELISEVCKKEGVNFAGHYTIVQRNCGAMCEGLYIVDRISGNVFYKLKPNDSGRWGFLYRKNSRILIANANALDDSLQHYSDIFEAPEVYAWVNDSLRLLQ